MIDPDLILGGEGCPGSPEPVSYVNLSKVLLCAHDCESDTYHRIADWSIQCTHPLGFPPWDAP
jgi:hypothetical protein